MQIIQKIKSTFPNVALAYFVQLIENNLKNCKSVLDVGCGSDSPLQHLSKKYKLTGVDAYAPAIKESKRKKIHQHYHNLDIKKLTKKFGSNSYDAVIALDVIEHFHKKEGYKLLKAMEGIAKKVVILNTPNGFIPQHNNTNNLQEHLSGWNTGDFRKLGYKVYGMYGPKFLRKEEGELKYRPKILFGIISVILHLLVTKYFPKFAYSLTAVKNKIT